MLGVVASQVCFRAPHQDAWPFLGKQVNTENDTLHRDGFLEDKMIHDVNLTQVSGLSDVPNQESIHPRCERNLWRGQEAVSRYSLDVVA